MTVVYNPRQRSRCGDYIVGASPNRYEIPNVFCGCMLPITRPMQGICRASLSEVVGTAVQQAGILKKLTLLDCLYLV